MRSGRKRGTVDIPQSRADREWLLSRYDSGAMSVAVYSTIKKIECEISWAEHWQRLGDVAGAIVKKLEP
jgi:hypothetical protein